MSSANARTGKPQTRRQILQATWDLFEEFSGDVRIRDVADRAGVSRQAVYLHFGNRTGLLVALVRFIDERLGLSEFEAHVLDAPTGEEALARLVAAVSTFTARIDSITAVFEAGKRQDEALLAAWRNRMQWRRTTFRTVLERVAAEGRLAERWTIDTAADLCFAITLPGPVRELTRELGWTPKQYAEEVAALLHDSLLTATPDRKAHPDRSPRVRTQRSARTSDSS